MPPNIQIDGLVINNHEYQLCYLETESQTRLCYLLRKWLVHVDAIFLRDESTLISIQTTLSTLLICLHDVGKVITEMCRIRRLQETLGFRTTLFNDITYANMYSEAVIITDSYFRTHWKLLFPLPTSVRVIILGETRTRGKTKH